MLEFSTTTKSLTGNILYSDAHACDKQCEKSKMPILNTLAEVPIFGRLIAIARIALSIIHVIGHITAALVYWNICHLYHVIKGLAEFLRGLIEIIPLIGMIFSLLYNRERAGSNAAEDPGDICFLVKISPPKSPVNNVPALKVPPNEFFDPNQASTFGKLSNVAPKDDNEAPKDDNEEKSLNKSEPEGSNLFDVNQVKKKYSEKKYSVVSEHDNRKGSLKQPANNELDFGVLQSGASEESDNKQELFESQEPEKDNFISNQADDVSKKHNNGQELFENQELKEKNPSVLNQAEGYDNGEESGSFKIWKEQTKNLLPWEKVEKLKELAEQIDSQFEIFIKIAEQQNLKEENIPLLKKHFEITKQKLQENKCQLDFFKEDSNLKKRITTKQSEKQKKIVRDMFILRSDSQFELSQSSNPPSVATQVAGVKEEYLTWLGGQMDLLFTVTKR